MFYFTYSILVFIVEMYVWFWFAVLACGLRFLVDLDGRLEECCNEQLLLGIVAFRLYLGSSWGMSRRGRRDVEEGIVRDGLSGA